MKSKKYSFSPKAVKDNFFILLLSVTCLFSIGVGEYVLLSRITNKNYTQTNSPKPTSISKNTPKPDPNSPIITSPSMGAHITSPVTVSGTVPAGWMFEGVFPVKMYDENGKLITQGVGREKTPGSWQSGEPAEFTSELNFTATTNSGRIVLENDNPSGMPENSKSFELEVVFTEENNQVFCTMEAKLCPDGKTYVGREGPKCEFAPCPN